MKIKNNRIDKGIEILCFVLMIGVTLYLILNWSNIPEKVPMHYDALGNIDRWGNRSEMILLPIMLWMMYGFMTVMEQFPQVWNTGVKVTEENRVRVYRTLKYMMKTIKLLIVILFTYLTIQPLTGMNMPVWFLPVELGLVFGNLIFWLVKLVRIK